MKFNCLKNNQAGSNIQTWFFETIIYTFDNVLYDKKLSYLKNDLPNNLFVFVFANYLLFSLEMAKML